MPTVHKRYRTLESMKLGSSIYDRGCKEDTLRWQTKKNILQAVRARRRGIGMMRPCIGAILRSVKRGKQTSLVISVCRRRSVTSEFAWLNVARSRQIRCISILSLQAADSPVYEGERWQVF